MSDDDSGLEIMFDELFIHMPDGRVVANYMDAQAFLTKLRELEAEVEALDHMKTELEKCKCDSDHAE